MFVHAPAGFFQLCIVDLLLVKVHSSALVLKIAHDAAFGNPCHVSVVFSVDFFLQVLAVEGFEIVDGEDAVDSRGALNLRKKKVTLALKFPLKSLV
jgi:hypothetical protein